MRVKLAVAADVKDSVVLFGLTDTKGTRRLEK